MSLPPDVVPLVRQFASNSIKYLFGHGDEVGDLLRWRSPEVAARIDFARMQAQPDSFVTPGFSALASDVLLRAPLRVGRREESIDVYVLIENQAEPEAIVTFRALRYVVMVYEQQLQRWMQTHEDTRDFRFHPVLPVVFYSGTRTWNALTPLRELVREGEAFGRRIPEIEPVFVNLAATSEDVLRAEVGTLGWVLWLTRQSKRKRGFADVLRQAVRRIDDLADVPGGRWERLLWYAHALVYHTRDAGEREQCAEYIRDTVREARKGETGDMKQTIGEAWFAEGQKKGEELERLQSRREILLLQLRERLGKISPAIEREIHATEDPARFDLWLRTFANAKKVSDIPFLGAN